MSRFSKGWPSSSSAGGTKPETRRQWCQNRPHAALRRTFRDETAQEHRCAAVTGSVVLHTVWVCSLFFLFISAAITNSRSLLRNQSSNPKPCFWAELKRLCCHPSELGSEVVILYVEAVVQKRKTMCRSGQLCIVGKLKTACMNSAHTAEMNKWVQRSSKGKQRFWWTRPEPEFTVCSCNLCLARLLRRKAPQHGDGAMFCCHIWKIVHSAATLRPAAVWGSRCSVTSKEKGADVSCWVWNRHFKPRLKAAFKILKNNVVLV